MSFQPPFVGDIDFTKIHFGPAETVNNRTKVEFYRDSSSTAPKNKLTRVNLCADGNDAPLTMKFDLDKPNEESNNPNRRGLAVVITDPQVIANFKTFDATIVAAAVKNSQQWFKKELSKDVIEARYKPILSWDEDKQEHFMKMKVKFGTDGYPTLIHLKEPTDGGRVRMKAGREEHFTRGAKVAPIVSATYGLWFLGGGSQFGVSFQAEEMIVTPNEAMTDSLAHFASQRPFKVLKEEDEAASPAADEPPPVTGESAASSGGVFQVELLQAAE